MKTFAFISCVIFSIVAINGDETCTTCKTTHSSKLDDADVNNKCSGLLDYINCLEGTKKTGAGCPLEKAEADKINAVVDDSCTTKFAAPCKCQQTFWGTVGSCTERIPALEQCLTESGITGKACDGTHDATALLAAAKLRCDKENNGNMVIPTAGLTLIAIFLRQMLMITI